MGTQPLQHFPLSAIITSIAPFSRRLLLSEMGPTKLLSRQLNLSTSLEMPSGPGSIHSLVLGADNHHSLPSLLSRHVSKDGVINRLALASRSPVAVDMSSPPDAYS